MRNPGADLPLRDSFVLAEDGNVISAGPLIRRVRAARTTILERLQDENSPLAEGGLGWASHSAS